METKALPLKSLKEKSVVISPEGLNRLNAIFDPQEPNKNVLWTTDKAHELPIYVMKEGPGAEKPTTLPEFTDEAFRKYAKRDAFRVKRNGKWQNTTYEQFQVLVNKFANGLVALGINPMKSLNIIGFNDPYWFLGFYGAIYANVMPVGVYTTNGPEACRYIADHSEAEIILAEDNEHLQKYLKVWETLPQLKYIILYNETTLPTDIPENRKSQVLLLKDFMELGTAFSVKNKDEIVRQRRLAQNPGNCLTIVYTSGTTGPPKGVMLSHDNYTWLSRNFIIQYGELYPIDKDEEIRIVTYLPLSHVAAQFADMVLPLVRGATVCFALPTALQGSLIDTLKEVRPNFLLSVPRMWEKIEEQMRALGKNASFPAKNLADWAKSIGIEGTLAELDNKPKPFGWTIAKTVVYNNVKKALGLDQCRALIYGAAPLNEATRAYFASLNIFLGNTYGMSECSGPHTLFCPGLSIGANIKSASPPLPGTETLIHAPDSEGNGEICFRGRHRFMGYFKDETSTKESIDNKGYLHSGDLGHIDSNGHLYITGRLKELIITAGGENIPPVLIEDQVKTAIPQISQCMIIGDNRKFLSMIITLKHVQAPDLSWTNELLPITAKDLKALGVEGKTISEIRLDPAFIKYMEAKLAEVNGKAISRAHNVRKWHLLDGDFSIAGGELTPTLKLKRKIVAKKYTNEIESLYIEPKL